MSIRMLSFWNAKTGMLLGWLDLALKVVLGFESVSETGKRKLKLFTPVNGVNTPSIYNMFLNDNWMNVQLLFKQSFACCKEFSTEFW